MKSSTDDGGNRVHLIRAGPAGNLCIPTLQFKMAETSPGGNGVFSFVQIRNRPVI